MSTAVTTDQPPFYEFGEFRVDTARRVLLRSGAPVPLTQKVFDTLLLLVVHQGKVVEKAEMMRSIWPDTIVEENNLTQNISALRRILGEVRGDNRYILTLPGRGYCFTAEVHAVRPNVAEDTLASITIGVLPFENLGAGPGHDYIADGLTEETIASIGQMDPERLQVVGRTSVMAYRGTSKTVAEIGRELNATYLVESSLRGEANLFRITSKLIRVRDQLQVWSETYDREPASLLHFQRELSIAIAQQVHKRLSPARLNALANRQTKDHDAYDLYLRGRYHWNQFAPLATRRAAEYFTQATELDPDYALAWSGLADALISSPVSGDMDPSAILPRAKLAAEQAARCGPALAEAQTSLGFYHFWLSWDWPAAEAAYLRALHADANYAFAHRMLGVLLSHQQRPDEAKAEIARARELDPLSAMNRALSSQVAFAAHDFSAAVEFARAAIVIDPEFWIGHFQLAQAYAQLGDEKQAVASLHQASRFSGGNSKTLSLRGYLMAKSGDTAGALEIIRTLEGIATQRFVPPYAVAMVFAGLGDHDTALHWLERAFEVHDAHVAFLTVDAKWDPLRTEPRFRTLLQRCGFAAYLSE